MSNNLRSKLSVERVAGIEPASSAWKAEVLPLNYTRGFFPGTTRHNASRSLVSNPWTPTFLVEGGGFEPPKLSRQIYSLIPLATREPLRKGAYSRDVNCPCQRLAIDKFTTSASPPGGPQARWRANRPPLERLNAVTQRTGQTKATVVGIATPAKCPYTEVSVP